MRSLVIDKPQVAFEGIFAFRQQRKNYYDNSGEQAASKQAGEGVFDTKGLLKVSNPPMRMTYANNQSDRITEAC